MAEYNGTIELISGITPKNNGTFPLVNAKDVAFYENGEEIRLTDKIQDIGISEETLDETLQNTQTIQNMQNSIVQNTNNISTFENQITTNTSNISELTNEVQKKYKMVVGNLDTQNVYLYKDAADITDNIANDVEIEVDGVITQNPKYQDYITSSIYVEGGGGGDISRLYKLSLSRITPSAPVCLYGESATVEMQLSNKEYDNTAEDYISPGGEVKLQWFVNNTLVHSNSVIVNKDTHNIQIDVGPYLREISNNNVTVYATNNEGTTRSMTWYVNALNVYITSTFEERNVYKNDVKINYSAFGSIDKTIYVTLDGAVIKSEKESASGISRDITISKNQLSHGAHRMKLYATIALEDLNLFIGDKDKINVETDDNGSISYTFNSNELTFGIIFAEDGNLTPIILTSYDNITLMQYSQVQIPFLVYTPQQENSSVQISLDGEIVSTQTVPTPSVNEPYNYYPYKPMEYITNEDIETEIVLNTKTLSIQTGNIEEKIFIKIEKFPYDIAPTTTGLSLHFNPLGRNNAETGYNEYYDKYYNPTENIMEVSSNFDWVNGGWTTDSNGDSCFLVKSGTTMTLNYPLFATYDNTNSFNATGRNIKFTFKSNLNKNFDSKVLSSYAHLKEGDSYVENRGVGLRVFSQHAYLSTNATELDLVYAENNKITLEFNITPVAERLITQEDGSVQPQYQGEILGLLDADYSRVSTYGQKESFSQENLYEVDNLGYMPLVFGSDDCDVYIYNFQVFSKNLTDNEIIDNYIAELTNTEEMIDEFKRNQIINTSNTTLIDPDLLAQTNPDLRVIQITIPKMPIDKKDVMASKVTQTYINGRPEDNWTLEGQIAIRGQGTSSMAYGAAALNLDLNIKDSIDKNGGSALFRYYVTEEGSSVPVEKTMSKYAMSDNDIAEKYFNIKVNVASSENANNAILADDYHRHQPYLRPARQQRLVGTGQYDTDGNEIMEDIAYKTRDTMKFYPCAIFIHETDVEDAVYFTNNQMVFWACGDFGNSKKNSDSLGMTDSPYECIVELCNNDDAIVRFLEADLTKTIWNDKTTDAPSDVGSYNKALEFRFTNGNDKKIFTDPIIQLNRASAQRLWSWTVNTNAAAATGKTVRELITEEYNFTWNFINNNIDKIQQIEGFENKTTDDIFSDLYKVNTAGQITHIQSTIVNPEYEYFTKAELIEKDILAAKNAGFETDTAEYRKWRFISEFDRYYISDSVMYHYLYTERHTMIDNRAKNVFTHTEDGTLWDFVFNYDNDTAMGIDNLGHFSYDFGTEDTDALSGQFDKSGKQLMAFNAFDSVLWCNVRDLFNDRLTEMFLNREASSVGAWDTNRILKEFNEYQQCKPKRLVMTDMRMKYLRPYLLEMDGYKISTNKYGQTSDYLPRMLGTKKWQRYYFETYQEKYMSSKYIGSVASTDRINFRIGSQNSGTITITPYSSMYVNLKMGNGTYDFHQRWIKGVSDPIEITLPAAGGNTECDIYTSSLISQLEGLAFLKVTSFSMAQAKKLQKLVIGSRDGSLINTNAFTDFTLGANELLEHLDISNMTNLSKITGLEFLVSLKELYAGGTALAIVETANGGKLEIIELNNPTDLYLQNLPYLHTVTLNDFRRLTTLTLKNCPLLDSHTLVENALYLNTLDLLGINWVIGTNAHPNNVLNRLVKINSDIEGSTEFKTSIRKAEIDAYTAKWPDLELIYDEGQIVPQSIVRFEVYDQRDGVTLLDFFEELVDNTVNLNDRTMYIDPIERGLIATPVHPFTEGDQYKYIYKYWQTTNNKVLDGNEYNTIYVNLGVTFKAYFDKEIAYYTVEWKADDTEDAMTVAKMQTKIGEEMIDGVPWGTSVSINDATILGSLPTVKAPDNINYYVFKNWSTPVATVQKNMTIYPQWVSSKGLIDDSVETETLKPEDIYALKAKGTIQTIFKSDDDFGRGDGKQIQVQLGYMPDFTDITSEVLAENYDFATSGPLSTGILPFANNESFTLVVDYENAATATAGALAPELVSCYNASTEQGFTVKVSPGKAPSLQYMNGTSYSVGYSNRDIFVIRKNKDDAGLYVYRNNRYSTTPVEEIYITHSTPFTHELELTFGGRKMSDGKFNSDTFCKFGILKYAKIWFDDLGEDECKNICSWIYDTLNFENVGKSRYTLGEGSTQTTFVATELLEQTVNFGATSAITGFSTSSIRTWLQNKVFKGFNLTWQNIISPVQVKTLEGKGGEIGKTITTTDYIYPPAYADVFAVSESDNFANELNLSTLLPFSTLDTSEERKKKLYNTEEQSAYWLRTPRTDTSSVKYYQYGITMDGTLGIEYKNGAGGSSQDKLGVLICFSI